MSTRVVLKNIHYFFTHILQNAVGSDSWDQNAINKAFEWALYCKETYNRIHGKPLEKQLDNILQNMFATKNNWKLGRIEVKILYQAPNILCKKLLMNTHLCWSLKSSVLNAYLTHNFKDELCTELTDIISSATCTKISQAIKKTPSLKLDSSVAEFIEFLNTLAISSNREEVLFEKTDEIARENLGLLLELVCFECDKISPQDCNLLKKWIEDNFWRIADHLITQQHADVLARVSQNSCVFLENYLQYLDNQIKEFEPRYTGGGHLWQKREASKILFTFDDVVQHFSCLRQTSGRSKVLTENLLSSKVADDECSSIWLDIKIASSPT